ncbi:trans-aconitate 2-methyltransferase [Paracoccus sp. MBLB3053]|uniref:Trans-aconitate 2-methyltransferase n=1 Tax=Paracoccus aurantius TaxID=3073814 RepID=A0ABU2HWJ8_9RHOB|nr:trans-aconitate 2-methyltransferase [Paracoccus sp. MBLB3053]MDS9469401.1 trans-aconitate 2-methyltransferase [Paracoccus sp. MBLB3053]
MGWDATQYSRFLDERTRPARDLLAAVPLTDPAIIVDLGCGPGNSTGLLAERYSEAEIQGIDSDPDMIAAARSNLAACRFTEIPIEDWRPTRAPDLIFANASLQWVGDHASLFPQLLSLAAPGGVLAVQMPDNLDEPSHRAMRAVAADPRWAGRLHGAGERRKPLLSPQEIHALLRPLCSAVDVWKTTYHFELGGTSAIVEWFKGSALRPYLELLAPSEQDEFLSAYQAEIRPAYPETAGRCLLAFPRHFFVARR